MRDTENLPSTVFFKPTLFFNDSSDGFWCLLSIHISDIFSSPICLVFVSLSRQNRDNIHIDLCVIWCPALTQFFCQEKMKYVIGVFINDN